MKKKKDSANCRFRWNVAGSIWGLCQGKPCGMLDTGVWVCGGKQSPSVFSTPAKEGSRSSAWGQEESSTPAVEFLCQYHKAVPSRQNLISFLGIHGRARQFSADLAGAAWLWPHFISVGEVVKDCRNGCPCMVELRFGMSLGRRI